MISKKETKDQNKHQSFKRSNKIMRYLDSNKIIKIIVDLDYMESFNEDI